MSALRAQARSPPLLATNGDSLWQCLCAFHGCTCFRFTCTTWFDALVNASKHKLPDFLCQTTQQSGWASGAPTTPCNSLKANKWTYTNMSLLVQIISSFWSLILQVWRRAGIKDGLGSGFFHPQKQVSFILEFFSLFSSKPRSFYAWLGLLKALGSETCTVCRAWMVWEKVAFMGWIADPSTRVFQEDTWHEVILTPTKARNKW